MTVIKYRSYIPARYLRWSTQLEQLFLQIAMLLYFNRSWSHSRYHHPYGIRLSLKARFSFLSRWKVPSLFCFWASVYPSTHSPVFQFSLLMRIALKNLVKRSMRPHTGNGLVSPISLANLCTRCKHGTHVDIYLMGVAFSRTLLSNSVSKYFSENNIRLICLGLPNSPYISG